MGAAPTTRCRQYAVTGWERVSRDRILADHIGSGLSARSVTAAPRSRAASDSFPCPEDHGVSREAYLPTQCPPPKQEARLPRPDEHSRRPCRVEVTPRQGPSPSVGLIGRIHTRSDFQRLRRDGRRVRIEPFWCSHLPDPTSNTAQVAFAINRAVGNAVTRNRLRRRLRAVLTELDLAGGLYLIGCTPKASELTFDQIRVVLAELPMKIARS